eukprot:comp9059_c0_seq1/m.4244 comp9059_c0_seq1/g.4244  ORF comp9059_c0_seq1/g.4244 comp9059_c0_seq1/m.4244 type:complete len:146 (-) comp9059_c0_seq1:335-772(-)
MSHYTTGATGTTKDDRSMMEKAKDAMHKAGEKIGVAEPRQRESDVTVPGGYAASGTTAGGYGTGPTEGRYAGTNTGGTYGTSGISSYGTDTTGSAQPRDDRTMGEKMSDTMHKAGEKMGMTGGKGAEYSGPQGTGSERVTYKTRE